MRHNRKRRKVSRKWNKASKHWKKCLPEPPKSDKSDSKKIWTLIMTLCKYECMILSHDVSKILTACRMLQISIALCQIKAEIHSFPTMYIIGGGKFGLTRWKKCLKPKRSPKNSCFGGNESQLHNFGRVWDPIFLRWPQFGGYPRKATCLSFKMSYVQGP